MKTVTKKSAELKLPQHKSNDFNEAAADVHDETQNDEHVLSKWMKPARQETSSTASASPSSLGQGQIMLQTITSAPQANDNRKTKSAIWTIVVCLVALVISPIIIMGPSKVAGIIALNTPTNTMAIAMDADPDMVAFALNGIETGD